MNLFELHILDFIQQLHTPLLDSLMPKVTSLGNAGQFWIILAVVLLLIPKTRKLGLVVTCALLFDLALCNILIKPLVARTRPFDVNPAIQLLISKPRDYSFPSGHTAASFAAATALLFAGCRRLGIPALVLAILIALSRLYLYVHYPTDVLGGVVIGVLCGFIGYKIVYKKE